MKRLTLEKLLAIRTVEIVAVTLLLQGKSEVEIEYIRRHSRPLVSLALQDQALTSCCLKIWLNNIGIEAMLYFLSFVFMHVNAYRIRL